MSLELVREAVAKRVVRRDLVDLLQHRPHCDIERERIHHSWVTTHVAGHLCCSIAVEVSDRRFRSLRGLRTENRVLEQSRRHSPARHSVRLTRPRRYRGARPRSHRQLRPSTAGQRAESSAPLRAEFRPRSLSHVQCCHRGPAHVRSDSYPRSPPQHQDESKASSSRGQRPPRRGRVALLRHVYPPVAVKIASCQPMDVRTRSRDERRARCRGEVPEAIIEKNGDARRLMIGLMADSADSQTVEPELRACPFRLGVRPAGANGRRNQVPGRGDGKCRLAQL